MDWLNRLKTHYSLTTKVAALGSGSTNKRQVVLYLGVLIGAVAKEIYEMLQGERPFSWPSLFLAIIASVVVFPNIYYSAGLDEGELTFGKWCLAFQNGFFWGVVMEEIAAPGGQPE